MTKFRRILMYILDLESNPKRVPLSEEDLQLAAHLIDLGESIDKGKYEITTEEREEEEPKGRFPKKGIFKASNLEVTCHSSHIMTKNNMVTFFEKVVFDSSMPKDILLIVDSWSTWKDTAAIDAVKPPSNKLKILMIPAGCTGNIQPCDVGIIGNFKKVVKTITNYAQLTHGNYKMHTRDETLKNSASSIRDQCALENEITRNKKNFP